MTAICAPSWSFAGGRSELVQPLDLLGAQLEVGGGGVLLDAGDTLGAGDRGDVVALSPTRAGAVALGLRSRVQSEYSVWS